MKNKPRFNKRAKSKNLGIKRVKVDIRPLDQRENPLNARKGMIRAQDTPVNINWLEKQQLLFDNSQRNCNGYIPKES